MSKKHCSERCIKLNQLNSPAEVSYMSCRAEFSQCHIADGFTSQGARTTLSSAAAGCTLCSHNQKTTRSLNTCCKRPCVVPAHECTCIAGPVRRSISPWKSTEFH